MAKTITYTKKLGALVAKRARAKASARFHVISSTEKNGWSVVSENSARSIRRFSSQKAAISFAKKYAQPKSIDKVIVHDRYGRVQNVITI